MMKRKIVEFFRKIVFGPLNWTNIFQILILSVILYLGKIDTLKVTANILSSLLFAFVLVRLIKIRFKFIKIIAVTLTVLVSAVSLLNCVIFSFWKFGIGINLFATLLESNANESGEYLLLIKELFLSHYLSILFIAALITGIILINRYLRKKKYALNNLSQLTIIVILLVCGFFLCRKISRQDDVRRNVLLSVRIGSDFKYALRAVKQYETFTNELNTLDSPETVKMNGDIKNIIFIIGESSNRMHYSLYDYYLPTTPHLEAMKDELFVFNDVISPFSGTGAVMQRLLTFLSSDAEGAWNDYPNIIDLFKTAGFTTFWFSNQERSGKYATCSSAISSLADYCKYLGMKYDGDDKNRCLDGDLIPLLQDALNEPDSMRFIILHMIGSHPVYQNRYPKEQKQFDVADIKDLNRSYLNEKKKRIIAHYDNSIYYTDSVITEVIGKVKLKEEKSVVIFMSDHSQAIFDRADFCGHCKMEVEIPFIVWLSPQYDNNDLKERFKNNIDTPAMTDNFIHVLADMIDLEYKYFDPTKSFINQKYIVKPRIADGEFYDK